MEYIRITKENIDKEHICCAMSGKQSLAKKDWLKQRFEEGLVFYRSAERGKCFIEYIPAENAWVPIEAAGWLYINCLWVSGSLKGHGYSSELLEECLRDKGASFERRQAILKQFIKEVRVGRDYNIEIVLNVPLDEFEEFKRHAASAGRGKNQKNKSQNPQKVGRCTSNAGIVVLDKTAGETVSIVPKNAAHAILRC